MHVYSYVHLSDRSLTSEVPGGPFYLSQLRIRLWNFLIEVDDSSFGVGKSHVWALVEKFQIDLGVYQSGRGLEVLQSLYTSIPCLNLCHQCYHRLSSTCGRHSVGMERRMKQKCFFHHHSLFFRWWNMDLTRFAPLSSPFCVLVQRKQCHLLPCFLP